jgi:hypothetical protein
MMRLAVDHSASVGVLRPEVIVTQATCSWLKERGAVLMASRRKASTPFSHKGADMIHTDVQKRFEAEKMKLTLQEEWRGFERAARSLLTSPKSPPFDPRFNAIHWARDALHSVDR